MKLTTALRTTIVSDIITAAGTNPKLKYYTGTESLTPAGTLLATLTLPSDWMGVAAAGVKAMSGSWTGTASGGAAATPTHFRIKQSATCHLQGTAGIGSGECQVNGTITSGQTVTVSSFQITAANT